MHQPMYMLLNLAVGDTGSWPGKYDASMPTAHMLVDYVHAYDIIPPPPPPAAPPAAPSPTPMVTGPGDVAALGGTYTLKPDGSGDIYDFTKAKAGISMDAAALPSTLVHTVWGSALADTIRGGSSNLNLSAGAGDDVFAFGTGTSRVQGGAGNDTFVLTRGLIAAGDQIIDFHLNLANGTEHDLLQLKGFSAAAHLDFTAASGSTQSYRVVDGTYVSPVLSIVVTNGTNHLSGADWQFIA